MSHLKPRYPEVQRCRGGRGEESLSAAEEAAERQGLELLFLIVTVAGIVGLVVYYKRGKQKAEARMLKEFSGRLDPEIWDELSDDRLDAYFMAFYASEAGNTANERAYLERSADKGFLPACWTLASDLLVENPVLHHAQALTLVKKASSDLYGRVLEFDIEKYFYINAPTWVRDKERKRMNYAKAMANKAANIAIESAAHEKWVLILDAAEDLAKDGHVDEANEWLELMERHFPQISNELGAEQNNIGSYFLRIGELGKATVCFEKAAQTGLPNAVASLVWLKTILDEHQEAITSFERHLPPALQYLEALKETEAPTEAIAEFSLQIPNIQSNAAISYFALGDVARANELWAKAADDEHYEAPLFMAVAARRQGQEIGGLPPVDPDKLEDLVTDCETALKHAVGWAKEWYEEARALAVELRRP